MCCVMLYVGCLLCIVACYTLLHKSVLLLCDAIDAGPPTTLGADFGCMVLVCLLFMFIASLQACMEIRYGAGFKTPVRMYCIRIQIHLVWTLYCVCRLCM